MTDSIKKINRKITKYCKRTHHYDEGIFNLGVEMGVFLAKKNISLRRPSAFIYFDKSKNLHRKKLNELNRITNILSLIVRNAVGEEINNSGEFRFDVYDFHQGKLSDDILGKYPCQIDKTRMPDDMFFEVDISFKGDIARTLTDGNFPDFGTVIVHNSSGDSHETMYRAEDASKIEDLEMKINISSYSVDDLKSTADKLEKVFLFLRMSI